MLIDEIIGHRRIVEHLKNTVDNNRVSHAQLFHGPEGVGTLQVAIAYAQYVLCSNSKDKEACQSKVKGMNHPDLHYVFPVSTTTRVSSKPKSKDFISDWNEFVKEEKFPHIQDWYKKIGIEKKAAYIGVEESADMIKTMNLSAYEGSYKIMIIWLPELMNISAANKLLKLIEEPSAKSLFLLVSEKKEDIISTILSRCQIVNFNRLSDDDVKTWIQLNYDYEDDNALNIALQSEGNISRAIKIIDDNSLEEKFQEYFVNLIRGSFKADVSELLKYTGFVADQGKQFQLAFLNYSIRVFRQAMLENYQSKNLSFLKVNAEGFKFENFVKFVHGQNIFQMIEEIELAIFHLERNGNAKIVLFDLFIKLTRGLHTKYKEQ